MVKQRTARALLLGTSLVLLSSLLPASPLAPTPARAGAPWSANDRVNEAGTGGVSPAVAVDASGNAYAVWRDWRNYTYNVYFSQRDAATGTWSANVRVNDDVGTASQDVPAIAVDAVGNVYAVWEDYRNDSSHPDIYFSRRDAATSAWGANVKVNDDSGAANQYFPAIAVDATGNAYAMWEDYRNGNSDIYFSRRDAATGAWSANVKVNDDAGMGSQGFPAIAVDVAGNAYAVWTDWRNGAYPDIYFSLRDAVAGVWGANVRVNDDAGTTSQTYPAIAVDAAGNAYAVWRDFRNGNDDIYFSRRDAATGAWSANVKVNDARGAARWGGPAIGVDPSGNAYAVWMDERNAGGGNNYDIYFSRRDAATGAWGANVKVNDDAGTAWQGNPAIAVDAAGNAYAAWEDERTGSRNIFFSRLANLANRVYLPFASSSASGW